MKDGRYRQAIPLIPVKSRKELQKNRSLSTSKGLKIPKIPKLGSTSAKERKLLRQGPSKTSTGQDRYWKAHSVGVYILKISCSLDKRLESVFFEQKFNSKAVKLNELLQRTLTVVVRIPLLLVYSLTKLDLTKKENMWLFV